MTVTIATLVACCLAAPLAVLAVECWLSLLPIRRHRLEAATRPLRLAIVIPAYNEQDQIEATVRSVQSQVGEIDQVIVIADNCDDATAERARTAGAIVWQRFDPVHRGKGYALNFAVERLSQSPPDVVVFVDADCVPGPFCIETLTRVANRCQRPAQAAYIMHAPPMADDLTRTSALAVYVKNVARPRGLQRLGFPCMANGSGMAFPWKALQAVRFPDAHITEDTRISGDLAIAGFAPVPCMEVSIASVLPAHQSGFMSQRTRWEHGHLATILRVVPRLLLAFVRRPRLQVLGILLELAVPPLSLLTAYAGVITLIVAAVSNAIGSWTPLVCFLGVACAAAAGLLAVWFSHGRKILSPRQALNIPRYALIKAPMYLRFVTHRQHTWVRTERTSLLKSTRPTEDRS